MSDDYRPRRKRSADRTPASSLRAMDGWVKGCLVVFLIGGAALAFWYYMTYWAPFNKHLKTYMTGTEGVANTSTIKKIVVDMDGERVDELHWKLSSSIRAVGPAQVTTIVQVRRVRNVVGRYTNGGEATRTDVVVTLKDLATKGYITGRTFTRGAPPVSFVGHKGDSGHGEVPSKEVVQYLEGLTRGKES